MTELTTADLAELEGRLAALETENQRLRMAETDAVVIGPRWRAVCSAICIVIAAILVPVAIVVAWARLQLVDENAFVNTLAPLSQSTEVQDMVIAETTDAIHSRLDVSAMTGAIVDGVIDLGVGERAEAALRRLESSASAGLTGLVDSTVEDLVRSDGFTQVWESAVRSVHEGLTLTATSDGGGIVVQTRDGLGIQLGPIVEEVKARLVDRGVSVASLIPAVDRVVIVSSGDTLTLWRTVYTITLAVGSWLPFVTVGLFIAGILFARRRSTAVFGTGLGMALGAASLATALTVGTTAVRAVARQYGVSPTAMDAIYRRLVDTMSQTAWVLVVLGGLCIAVLGWLFGPSRAAVAMRTSISDLHRSARAGLARRGFDTGRFGSALARYRVLIRVLIVVVAVIWLFALRPLSLADVVAVVLTAIVVAEILELLQRRPGEEKPTARVRTSTPRASPATATQASVVPVPGPCPRCGRAIHPSRTPPPRRSARSRKA